jgi:hypothetical protein
MQRVSEIEKKAVVESQITQKVKKTWTFGRE